MTKGIESAETNLPDTQIQERTFSSRASSLKDVIEGDAQVTTDGSGVATATVYHYLSYPPAHLFFFKPGNTNAILHPGTNDWIDKELSTTWGLQDNFTFSVIADATTCTVSVKGVPNTTYYYKWFIFVEKAKS